MVGSGLSSAVRVAGARRTLAARRVGAARVVVVVAGRPRLAGTEAGELVGGGVRLGAAGVRRDSRPPGRRGGGVSAGRF